MSSCNAGIGHAGGHEAAEHAGVDQLLERFVDGLQEDLLERLVNAGHARPPR